MPASRLNLGDPAVYFVLMFHDHIKLTSTISFHSLWGAVATLNLAGDNPGKNMLEKSIPELSAQL